MASKQFDYTLARWLDRAAYVVQSIGVPLIVASWHLRQKSRHLRYPHQLIDSERRRAKNEARAKREGFVRAH